MPRESLQAHRHAHVRGQVRAIDLQPGARHALDRPAEVQAEADGSARTAASRDHRRMHLELRHVGVLDDGQHDLGERHDAQVRGALPLGRLELLGVAHQRPHQEEGPTDVFVHLATVFVDGGVHDPGNLIDEENGALLVHLQNHRKVLDLAIPVYGLHLRAPHVRHALAWVHALADVIAYHLSGGLTEADGEQAAKLDDRVLKNLRLQGVAAPLLLRLGSRSPSPPAKAIDQTSRPPRPSWRG
mmetsp:Transcript_60192/g.183862  ORF Transcript_60192/g.183862 Transcript_60192/m.183862 type:complete len:243 (+) Transcript_60192:758-1486(+)